MARAAAAVQEPADIATFTEMVRAKRGGGHAYVTLLGLKTFEAPKLLERVEAGFSYRAFERLRRNLGLGVDGLAGLVQISRRTLARRQREGRFTAEESDRLLRVGRVFGRALALFEGDAAAARAWFATPAPALAGRTPQAVSATGVGAREVEALVGRLEHGVFA